MPVVACDKEELFSRMGREYTQSEFEDLCFEYGIELDEVTSARKMKLKEYSHSDISSEELQDTSEAEIYKIDVPANRSDLLCVEGVARALRVFLALEAPADYSSIIKPPSSSPSQDLSLYVNYEHTRKVRPYVVGAVLRNVNFTAKTYQSFIDLQDKLHQTVCRRRSLVAIGTHDLDSIQGPFYYEAFPPKEIVFRALNRTEENSAEELMSIYDKSPQLKHFLKIIRDAEVYPVIKDSQGVVLSMPPIINGDHSKISLTTKNVFIECTATDLTRAHTALNQIVTSFHTGSIEQVKVIYNHSQVHDYCTPLLDSFTKEVAVSLTNSLVGINVTAESVCSLLEKMQYSCRRIDSTKVAVSVPPTRPDVMHSCDIMEDVAIAYGYNKIHRVAPKLSTQGRPEPVNALTEKLRIEIGNAGFMEVVTFALLSKDECGEKMRKPHVNERDLVEISAARTPEFQVVRNSLIPGLLKTLSCNRGLAVPVKIFEVQDIVLPDPCTEVGARNERHCAALYCNTCDGCEIVHGLLDVIMDALEVPSEMDLCPENSHSNSNSNSNSNPNEEEEEEEEEQPRRRALKHGSYHLENCNDPSFLPQRAIAVVRDCGQRIGVFGVLHPEVLQRYGLKFPCTALELNLKPFV